MTTRPRVINENRVWDVATMSWVVMKQPILEGGTVVVTGALTDAQLRAAPVVITGAVVSL